MRKTRCVVALILAIEANQAPFVIESPRCDVGWRFVHLCVAVALRTALDIGNGNIASVRLVSIFARIGTAGSKNMQTKIR